MLLQVQVATLLTALIRHLQRVMKHTRLMAKHRHLLFQALAGLLCVHSGGVS